MPEWMGWFAVFSALNFLLLTTLAYQSRHWTGPAIASKLQQLEERIASNTSNILALQHDREYDRRMVDSVLENLAKEINVLSTAISNMTAMRDKVTDVDIRTIEIEQQLSALACSERDWHAKHNSCPPDVKAKFTNGSS